MYKFPETGKTLPKIKGSGESLKALAGTGGLACGKGKADDIISGDGKAVSHRCESRPVERAGKRKSTGSGGLRVLQRNRVPGPWR